MPQGSCISPVLFNFFVSSYPHTTQLTTSYADDFTDSHSDSSPSTAAMALSAQAERVSAWAEERGLAISAPKSTVTLFTSDFRQSHDHPHVTLANSPLPLERNPRILGVTFDPHFTFSPHVASIVSRATPRLNLLKALAGSTWGQQMETIVLTYKSLIRSLFTYACPIWFPNSSRSSIQKLQSIQNHALRIATGCVKMSAIDHLHTETKLLPVADHLSLLSSQFLARALQPHHPSYSTVSSPSGPRSMKNTLQSRYLPSVAPHLVGDALPPVNYRNTIQCLHTEAVANAIASQAPNRVLGSPPPAIAEEERTLPRPYRSTLSQLRSGFCRSLNYYRERIGRAQDPRCPHCRGGAQTTNHIFSCPVFPTSLEVVDLWHRPGSVSRFISTLPFFDLPHLPPPPPEPPP